MNWIPCEERMPEKHCTVLVVYTDKHVRFASYHGDYWHLSGDAYGTSLSYVSHWMPLPELPDSVKRKLKEFERIEEKLLYLDAMRIEGKKDP